MWPDLGHHILCYPFRMLSMGCGYDYTIIIFVFIHFQDQTPSIHGEFGPRGSFIHHLTEKHLIKICRHIFNWTLGQVVIPVESGITLLGIWITIFYLVFIQCLIDCFIISFSWQGDLTNIFVIKDFSSLLLGVYHISFVIDKVVLFLFIWISVWIPKRWVWDEEYCFKMINVFNIFRCNISSG